MTYELVTADTLDTPQHETLRAIYEGGYAAGERAPWRRVCTQRVDSDDAVALLRGDEPVGFAALRGLTGSEHVFLRYLVIDAAHRGQGLGAHFWSLLTSYAGRRGFRRLVWDVVVTDAPTDEDGHAATPQRIGFYERAGGSLVPIGEYADDSAERIRSTPVRLMTTAVDGSEDAIDERELRRLALDVYAYRYQLTADSAAEHET